MNLDKSGPDKLITRHMQSSKLQKQDKKKEVINNFLHNIVPKGNQLADKILTTYIPKMLEKAHESEKQSFSHRRDEILTKLLDQREIISIDGESHAGKKQTETRTATTLTSDLVNFTFKELSDRMPDNQSTDKEELSMTINGLEKILHYQPEEIKSQQALQGLFFTLVLAKKTAGMNTQQETLLLEQYAFDDIDEIIEIFLLHIEISQAIRSQEKPLDTISFNDIQNFLELAHKTKYSPAIWTLIKFSVKYGDQFLISPMQTFDLVRLLDNSHLEQLLISAFSNDPKDKIFFHPQHPYKQLGYLTEKDFLLSIVSSLTPRIEHSCHCHTLASVFSGSQMPAMNDNLITLCSGAWNAEQANNQYIKPPEFEDKSLIRDFTEIKRYLSLALNIQLIDDTELTKQNLIDINMFNSSIISNNQTQTRRLRKKQENQIYELKISYWDQKHQFFEKIAERSSNYLKGFLKFIIAINASSSKFYQQRPRLAADCFFQSAELGFSPLLYRNAGEIYLSLREYKTAIHCFKNYNVILAKNRPQESFLLKAEVDNLIDLCELEQDRYDKLLSSYDRKISGNNKQGRTGKSRNTQKPYRQQKASTKQQGKLIISANGNARSLTEAEPDSTITGEIQQNSASSSEVIEGYCYPACSDEAILPDIDCLELESENCKELSSTFYRSFSKKSLVKKETTIFAHTETHPEALDPSRITTGKGARPKGKGSGPSPMQFDPQGEWLPDNDPSIKNFLYHLNQYRDSMDLDKQKACITTAFSKIQKGYGRICEEAAWFYLGQTGLHHGFFGISPVLLQDDRADHKSDILQCASNWITRALACYLKQRVKKNIGYGELKEKIEQFYTDHPVFLRDDEFRKRLRTVCSTYGHIQSQLAQASIGKNRRLHSERAREFFRLKCLADPPFYLNRVTQTLACYLQQPIKNKIDYRELGILIEQFYRKNPSYLQDDNFVQKIKSTCFSYAYMRSQQPELSMSEGREQEIGQAVEFFKLEKYLQSMSSQPTNPDIS